MFSKRCSKYQHFKYLLQRDDHYILHYEVVNTDASTCEHHFAAVAV